MECLQASNACPTTLNFAQKRNSANTSMSQLPSGLNYHPETPTTNQSQPRPEDARPQAQQAGISMPEATAVALGKPHYLDNLDHPAGHIPSDASGRSNATENTLLILQPASFRSNTGRIAQKKNPAKSFQLGSNATRHRHPLFSSFPSCPSMLIIAFLLRSTISRIPQKRNPAKSSRTGFKATRHRHPVLFILSLLFILSQAFSSLLPEFRPKIESGETFFSLNVRSFHAVYPVHPCQ